VKTRIKRSQGLFGFHTREVTCGACGWSLEEPHSLEGMENRENPDLEVRFHCVALGFYHVGSAGVVVDSGSGCEFTTTTDQVDFRCNGCGEPVNVGSQSA
jgi:ribosomal protein S27E